MKSCYLALAILLHNLWLYNQGNPVIACTSPRFKTEHGETSGKAGNTSENGLEGLGKVVGNEVFEDLNACHPRPPLVRYAGLPTNAHDHRIMMHAIDKMTQGLGERLGICIHLGRDQ